MYLDKIVRTVKQTFEIDIPPICIIHNQKKFEIPLDDTIRFQYFP